MLHLPRRTRQQSTRPTIQERRTARRDPLDVAVMKTQANLSLPIR